MTTRAPRRDAQANRDGILAAARDVLAADPNASIDAIARAAGLTRRTLYGHFEDRGALISELIATGAQRFNDVAGQPTDPNAAVALAQLASRLWREAAHVRLVAGMALDDAHVEGTAAALAPVRRMLADIVARGQADGSLRTDMDAAALAHLIEATARMAIRDLTSDDGRIAVRAVLGAAGLSWREVEALRAGHPEFAGAPRNTGEDAA